MHIEKYRTHRLDFTTADITFAFSHIKLKAMPYIGEIRLFAHDTIPQGWQKCDGTALSVYQNEALFHLIGNSYGGDGVSTFCVPNLAGRVVGCLDYIDQQTNVAAVIGSETVTLTQGLMPIHTHSIVVPPNEAPMASSNNGMHSTPDTTNNVLAVLNDPGGDQSKTNAFYNGLQPDIALNIGAPAPAVGNAGSANPQPVSLMQPYLVLNYCISLTDGIWPTPGD